MAKFKIFENESDVKITNLKLSTDNHNRVILTVVDENGDNVRNGDILRINHAGTLCLFKNVSREFDFKLDCLNRVEVHNSD